MGETDLHTYEGLKENLVFKEDLTKGWRTKMLHTQFNYTNNT